MYPFFPSDTPTVVASGAITANSLVKINSISADGTITVALAGASDRPDGICYEAIADAASGPMHVLATQSFICVRGTATIAAGALVYAAASGGVGTTNTNAFVGKLVQAVTNGTVGYAVR